MTRIFWKRDGTETIKDTAGSDTLIIEVIRWI
jgi:hypothetical protein